ncbi:hypothetical protein M0802_007929 [Mischocyttarus mexicanus]|nr:hypothetical protein M0802_007929 [Mischocyttarus mexicanus]
MAKNLDHGTFLPNKLINNGNRYKIQTGDITEKDQPSKETKQYPNLANTERRKIKIDNRDLRMDSEMDTDSEDVQEWIPAKSTKLKDFKKRKISEVNNNNNISSAPTPTKWLQEIPISNLFNLLEDSTETQNNTEKQEETKSVKPPPIYIEAEVIDPLLELLDETAGRNNYIIKQLKDNQVKVQTSTPDTFRKVISALKNKNAGYHTKKVLENPILDEAYKDNHNNKQNVNANTDYIPVLEHNKPIRSYADVTKQTYLIVVLKCSDTDIVVIMLGLDLDKVLPGFHAFTSCDYNAAFFKKGKQRPFKILAKNKEFQQAFASLGNKKIDIDNVFVKIETFVCSMYGYEAQQKANNVRCLMFLQNYKVKGTNKAFIKADLRNFDASCLPPCYTELLQHMKMAHYMLTYGINPHYRIQSNSSLKHLGRL